MAHSPTSADSNALPHDGPGAASGHHDDHGGTGKYWMVFLALCVLTSLSFITMHFFGDTPSIGWTIMMAVSCAKALLVISFFMHLIWEANWKWVLTIPAAMMSVFLMLMLVPDVGCRVNSWAEESWIHAPDREEPAAPHGHGPADGHPHPAGDGHQPPAEPHSQPVGGAEPAKHGAEK